MRRGWLRLCVWLACSSGGVLGCRGDAFTCADDASCVEGAVHGTCEATGYCSFPDAECSSGRRYGKHAAPGLAGTCVPDDDAQSTDGTGFEPGESEVDSTTSTSSGDTTPPTTTSEPSTEESGDGPVDAWFDPAWVYRKPVTIPGGRVTADLTDFPVLVSSMDEDLRDLATESDIIFTASDHRKQLAHEIELFDASTGTLVAWVQLPQLDAGSDNTFYMYFGNAGASDQQDRSTVWSAYAIVLHFAGDADDSTQNSNDGVVSGPAPTAGKMGQAFDFPGTGSNRITIARDASWLPSTRVFFSCWFRAPSPASLNGEVLVARDSGGSNENFGLAWDYMNPRTRMRVNSTSFLPRNPSLSSGTWHLVHGVYDVDSTPRIVLYNDGVEVLSSNDMSGPIDDSGSPLAIGVNLAAPGTEGDNSRRFEGVIDEVRLSTSFTPSAAWIAAEYANQQDPQSFLTVGPREDYGR
jgi:hypothetical protein